SRPSLQGVVRPSTGRHSQVSFIPCYVEVLLLNIIKSPSVSHKLHQQLVQTYGRSIRIRGLGPWDTRLLTLDPLSIAHVLKNSTIYEKPWQSRRLITSLIGCGMLSAEGIVHKRQRRVATPAFSIQNLRELVPVVFRKGDELKERLNGLLNGQSTEQQRIDVCHWISRATFDVIGLAGEPLDQSCRFWNTEESTGLTSGFDYSFNAIEDESNPLLMAYKEMFEVAISQGTLWRSVMRIYMPRFSALIGDETFLTVQRCQEVIHRVAGNIIQEKKRKIFEGEVSGIPYDGKDLLSLLLKSNTAKDLPEDQQISDEDILNNINTFLFAGSDTSSLTLTWTILLLAQNSVVQDRLRAELLTVTRPSTDAVDLTDEEINSLYSQIADLPYLHNVVRECIRLIPPVHSSIRVATQDDEIPTSTPVILADGSTSSRRTVSVPKGSFVHVPVEGFNLDLEFWGEDAWEFWQVPDRWDNLSESAQSLPGLFSNTLTFSAGPRSCIGMRFSMIEIKAFLYTLVTNFVFAPTDERIFKANVVLTRPYIAGKFKEGSQCPILVSRYRAAD
ncbi:hypothetical protein CVT24_000171, partial [Panaeolus cyanescens]